MSQLKKLIRSRMAVTGETYQQAREALLAAGSNATARTAQQLPYIARPKEHEIDELARRVFTCALPTGWVARPSGSDDYAIDYQIEVFESHQPVALRTAVQLKGTASPDVAGQRLRFRLDVRALATYVDREPLPVFLVVVDVTTKTAYYCFLQRYALTKLRRTGWRDQATVTIDLDLSDRVDDTPRLLAALRDAQREMASLRPGSVAASIDAEQKRLESIDPRFSVLVSADANGMRHQLVPREKVTFTLGLHTTSEKMERFRTGGEVSFLPQEIRIDGMPLWRELSANGAAVRVARTIAGSATIRARSASGRRSELPNVPATLVIGLDGFRIECSLGGLVKMDLQLPRLETDGSGMLGVSLACSLDPWIGHDVRSLAHFATVTSFAELLGEQVTLDIVLQMPGRNAAMPPISINTNSDHSGFARALACLAQAREVAARLDQPIVMCHEVTEEDARETKKVHDLALRREYRNRGDRATINVVFDGKEFEKQRFPNTPSDIRMELGDHRDKFIVLGSEVWCPVAEIVLTKATYTMKRLQSGDVRLKFGGTRDAEFIMRAPQENTSAA